MTDFDKVDVSDFLTALGVQVGPVSGLNLTFACPWHNDGHPSARMHLQTTQWICSAGCGSGNAITFLARLRSMTNSEARGHIDRRYGAGPMQAIGEFELEVARNLTTPSPIQDDRILPTEAWVGQFMASWEASPEGRHALSYMLGRGFDREILDTWGIGFDSISQRIAIPVRAIDGTLVGFKARAVFDGQEPRYLILGDSRTNPRPRYGFHPYSKSQHVYGLERVPWAAPVVIIEGELNVVAMAQKTPQYHAVGVAGSEFSEIQRRLIVEKCYSAIVFFDNDLSGIRGRKKVRDALSVYMPIGVVVGADGDAAELAGAEIVSLVEGSRSGLELAVEA